VVSIPGWTEAAKAPAPGIPYPIQPMP